MRRLEHDGLTDTMAAMLCNCRQDLMGVYRSERKGGSVIQLGKGDFRPIAYLN